MIIGNRDTQSEIEQLAEKLKISYNAVGEAYDR